MIFKKKKEAVVYNRAKIWQIAMFAMNNAATNIYLAVFTYVSYYATGVLGLVAIFISQVMGYIRIFDGLIDPTIGVIIDKTETKFGKYRPILILGNIITALSFIFLFNLDALGEDLRLPMFLIALIIHKIGYSLQQTITKAGQTALTNDPSQRPIFNIVDAVMTTSIFTGSQVVISKYLIPKHGGDFTKAFFTELITAIIIISAILSIIAIIGIWQKDRKEFFGLGEKTKKTYLGDYWKIIKGNKPLQVLSLASALIKFVAQLFTDSVIMVMLYGILFGNFALLGELSLIMIAPGILANIIFSSIARKKGLRYSYVLALKVGALGLIGLILVLLQGAPGKLSLTNMNFYTILFLTTFIIGRYCSTSPSSLVLTMGADISDYETSVSGRYVSGMIGTVFSFTDSIASSFAPMVVGFVVAAIGFAKEYPTIKTPLTPNLKLAAITLIGVIPLVAVLIALLLMRFYKLDKEEMFKIQAKISEMKAE